MAPGYVELISDNILTFKVNNECRLSSGKQQTKPEGGIKISEEHGHQVTHAGHKCVWEIYILLTALIYELVSFGK